MRDRLRVAAQVRYLMPRSLWIIFLYAVLACISLIAPKEQAHAASVSASPRPLRRHTLSYPSFAQMRRRLVWHHRELTARQQLGRALGTSKEPPPLPLPDINDILVLCYGIPVVPWLKKVGVRQWANWLDRVGETLRARYPDCEDIAAGPAWEAWLERHVRYVETHFARLAGPRIAQLLSTLPNEFDAIYLFGHSAGGSAVLQYLADLRDGVAPAPALPIRAVLTLNAAVSGPARLWTGWPIANERPALIDRVIPKLTRYIVIAGAQSRLRWHVQWARTYIRLPFRGLGEWADNSGITLLTVSNSADYFGHRRLDDLPFLSLKMGRRRDVKNALNGKTHIAIQRDPRVPRFIWWHDAV